jgi:hypothetical protein
MEYSQSGLNRCGLADLAFEVNDVEEILQLLLQNGGGQIGELVKTAYSDGRKATLEYHRAAKLGIGSSLMGQAAGLIFFVYQFIGLKGNGRKIFQCRLKS